MHHEPALQPAPFFLGGRQRVHDEALGGALMLIQALRAYPVD
ncbi:hypothetical protein ACN28S_51335 [Cystobacter fuscus]